MLRGGGRGFGPLGDPGLFQPWAIVCNPFRVERKGISEIRGNGEVEDLVRGSPRVVPALGYYLQPFQG